ncbi:hypothetical protein ACS0TY_005804 [Phlomoides rotata]
MAGLRRGLVLAAAAVLFATDVAGGGDGAGSTSTLRIGYVQLEDAYKERKTKLIKRLNALNTAVGVDEDDE